MSNVLPTLVDGGGSKAEWDALITAVGATMGDANATHDATGSTAAKIANDFLLTENADLGEATPLVMVRRDWRGIAKVALVAGNVPAPFVDADGDKLADVDAAGRFVDASGAVIMAPTPFATTGDVWTRDDQGRAVDGSNTPIYEYFDVTKTLLGSMLNDQVAMIDPARRAAPRSIWFAASTSSWATARRSPGRSTTARRSPIRATTARSRRCSIWATRSASCCATPTSSTR